MANNYGANYTKEWINEPSEKANKATRNAAVKYFYDTFTGVADTNVVYICKLEGVKGIFLGLEEIVGEAGTGVVQKIDKAGTATTIVAGDEVDAKIDGGYVIALVATATTAATLKLAVKFLLD